MHLNEIRFGSLLPIEGYGPGFFRIGGNVLQGPVLIHPAGVTGWGGFADPAPLLALAGSTDVIFCGMGPEPRHLPRDLRDQLEAAGLGVEAMDTPAAARTYNICLSEGRRVAAALLAV